MSWHSVTNRVWVRGVLLAIGSVALLFAARFIVLALIPEQTETAGAPTPSSTEPTSTSISSLTTTTAPTGNTSSTMTTPANNPRPNDGSRRITVDEPTIQPFQARTLDVVSVHAGIVPPVVFAGDSAVGQTDGLIIELPPTSNEQAPEPRGFGVGATVKIRGHFALFEIGVSTDETGLTGLAVDFGDGSSRLLRESELSQLEGGGTVDVLHEYEPTLTPQPWTASVTGTSGEGVVRSVSLDLTTQAEFLLGYSALSVTALRDCDLFGKGDFTLVWNNDGRERRATFDLGAGETFVAEDFRVGLDSITYDDPIPLEVGIVERDNVAISILKFELFYQLITGDGPLAERAPELFAEVMQLGSHSYPVSVRVNAGGNCDTQFDFTITLALDRRHTP